MNVKEQVEDFNKLTDDVNRWRWVMDVAESQRDDEDKTIKILMDNDQTFLVIDDGGDYEDTTLFIESIGQAEGVITMLDVLHIKSEFV